MAEAVPDTTLSDLKLAMRALDALPNQLVLERCKTDIDVATISAALGGMVRLIELEQDLANVNEVRLLLHKARIALTMGDTATVKRLHTEAQALLDRANGIVF